FFLVTWRRIGTPIPKPIV
ncbi:hypothetical protein JTE90_028622, partial [Oedothorax gibbosus]